MASGAIGGAVAGAKAGAAVGGVYGAIIGGAVGLVAGIFSDKKKKLAKRAGRAAANISRQQQAMQLAIQRRDVVRQARANRALAVAAGASEERIIGTGTSGVASSVGSQLTEGLNYFDTQVALDYQANEYRKKAGKYAGQAADINSILSSASSLAELGANIYGASKKPKK